MSELPLYAPDHNTERGRGLCERFGNGNMEGVANYFTEMCSGSEAGSYLRLIDLWL